MHGAAPVVVADVARDPLPPPYRDLAAAHGVGACWSFPLHSPSGRVLGTLTFYHAAARTPSPALAAEIGYFTDLLALLTERHLREQDSTARQDAAERELATLHEESERRRRLYETVLSATPDLVYVFDLEHRFTFANAVLLKLLGKTLEEAVGKTFLELGYEPWHAAMHDREIEQVKATRKPIRGEVPFTGTVGPRIYDYIFVPILGPDGEVEAVAGTTRDVTERKRFEEELRDSELRFRTITNAMPQMVWTALPDGTVDYHNEQFYAFVGMAAGTAEGTAWAESLLHPDDREPGRARWEHSVATGDPYEITYRARHHSGEYRWILARGRPLRDESGVIVKWLGTDTDIHESKLNEEALQAANHRKDEFLAMLAHELRNPLAPISAAAQVLRLMPHNADKVRQYSEVISRQVSHMTTLVNDLLDVSRVTRGMVQLEQSEVDVKSVVTSAAEQVHPLVEGGGHALALQLGSARACVLGDRARLIQVTANLLANAAKYTPRGGTITLAVDVEDGKVRIVVSDNGNGIDAALLPHVFDLFVQGKRTPDRARGGLGLGLALVKNIVGMHGGQVAVHSEGAGRGARFTVELPSMAASAPQAPSAPSCPRPRQCAPRGRCASCWWTTTSTPPPPRVPCWARPATRSTRSTTPTGTGRRAGRAARRLHPRHRHARHRRPRAGTPPAYRTRAAGGALCRTDRLRAVKRPRIVAPGRLRPPFRQAGRRRRTDRRARRDRAVERVKKWSGQGASSKTVRGYGEMMQRGHGHFFTRS
ncbi:PAS domain-containing protein [Massilia sp. Se16.2.3]|nr:PAS domain-containing sensor histidine kinase [Massilia sp. Se16.2.3]QNA98365.1 PAS domain-containing protein [Massilia sp. Se16.2.3]